VAHWRLTTARQPQPWDEYGVHARTIYLSWLGSISKPSMPIAIASVVAAAQLYAQTDVRGFTSTSRRLFVDHSTELGLKILYEAGSRRRAADRLVGCRGPQFIGMGGPCIIVDFGTATTFNAINRMATNLGGVITPGIMISADALFERTAKLPRVDIKRPRESNRHLKL